MSIDATLFKRKQELDELTHGHSSPFAAIGKKQPESLPHFTDTSITGTLGSGMIRGSGIIELNGETYGDTNINLKNEDNLARIKRAQEVIPEETEELYQKPDKMAAFFDAFAKRIHQKDVVGDYFPEVLVLQAQQNALMAAAYDSVLSGGAVEQIRALEESRNTQNSIDWAKRSPTGAVTNEAVLSIEQRNEEVELAILDVKKLAAIETLGHEEAARIETSARQGLD